jgi:hypothetical protein
MKSVLLLCGLALLCVAKAQFGVGCSDHLYCATGQTCMSDADGAGKVVRKINVPNLRFALFHAYCHYTVWLFPSPQCSALPRRARILPRLLHLHQR